MRPAAKARSGDRLLVAAVLLVAALLAAQVAFVPAPDSPTAATESRSSPAAAADMRDVDIETIRRRIIEGQLSDREAEHYRKLAPAPGGKPPH